MTALTRWQNFYVITGSSAGALVGLQFVVLSLVNNWAPSPSDPEAGSAFASPNIVHFTSVLALSAMLSAPWDDVGPAAILWGLLGLAGLIYVVIVTRRMRRQQAYRPEFEDWLFHSLLPLAAYTALAVSAGLVRWHERGALFGAGETALALLFIGIHNAWDAVMYHVYMRSKKHGR